MDNFFEWACGIGSEDKPFYEWYHLGLILMEAERTANNYLKLCEILKNLSELTSGGPCTPVHHFDGYYFLVGL